MNTLTAGKTGMFERVMPLLAVALLGMLIYASAVGGSYVYDDVIVAQKDKRLADPRLWGLFWSKDYYYDLDAGDGSVDNLYRPLVSMSFAVQVWLHGVDRPGPMHVANVLMYGVCCAVVTRLGRQVSGRGVGGWVAGLLFAVHPAHAEVVCALVGRAEMMAMLGVCGALTIHLSGPLSWGRTWGVVGCTVLGLLSKEQGMLVPGVLLAGELVRRGLHGREGDNRAAGQCLVICVCVATGFYIVLREQILGLKFWWDRHFLDEGVQPLKRDDADRGWMPWVLFGNYLRVLVWPVNPSFDYSGAAIGWKVRFGDPHLYVGMVASVAGVVSLVVAGVRRNWRWVLVLVGFALSYGVISNAVSLIGVIFAERLLFLPSVFFCVGLGMLVAGLGGKWRAGALIALGLAVVAGGVISAIYAARWTDPLTFYEYSHRTNPKAIRIQQLLLFHYQERGRLEDAARITAIERETMPDYWAVWIDSSVVAEKQGKWEEAETYMARAHKINPQVVGVQLGNLQVRRREALMRSTRPSTGPTTVPAQ